MLLPPPPPKLPNLKEGLTTVTGYVKKAKLLVAKFFLSLKADLSDIK